MSSSFSITAPGEIIRLDPGGRGEISITVANRSGRPQRGLAQVTPLGNTSKGWIAIAGEVEREFPIDGVHQFTIRIATPAGTPADRYTFRIDMADAQRTGEELAEGPTVAFEVQPTAKPSRRFPWRIAAAAVLVLVCAVVLWLLLRGEKAEEPLRPPTAAQPGVPDTPAPPTPPPVVPDVTGAPVAAARDRLRSAGLEVVSEDWGYRDMMQPGSVLGTNPAAGEPIPEDRKVWLTIQVAYGPDTCKQGFVWRDARHGDHVCVTQETRGRTAAENATAAIRRSPNGGPYGADTCKQGFVWRDAFPGDHVCVEPDVRQEAQNDNAAAASRKAIP